MLSFHDNSISVPWLFTFPALIYILVEPVFAGAVVLVMRSWVFLLYQSSENASLSLKNLMSTPRSIWWDVSHLMSGFGSTPEGATPATMTLSPKS